MARARLDILVSHYDEPVETVVAFLSMLDGQDADPSLYRVVVGNDGHVVPVPVDAMSGHRYDVSYVETHHGGVSHIRNMLIDASSSEYLMLCDVDDRFSDATCLSRFIEMCDGHDVIASWFEHRGDVLPPSTTLVHGKAFRRGYLLDNGIRFDEDLVMSSDEYFLVQASLLTRSVLETDECLYVWSYREDSVCHRERDFSVLTHWYHVEAEGRLAARFSDVPHLEGMFAARLVHRSYIRMHTEAWERNSEDVRCRFAVRCLSWWLRRLYGTYLSLPEDARRYRYGVELRRYGVPDPGFCGIDAWARRTMERECQSCAP